MSENQDETKARETWNLWNMTGPAAAQWEDLEETDRNRWRKMLSATSTPEAAGREDEREDLARAVASVLPFLNELRAVVYRKVAPLCHHALRNYTMEQVKALRRAPPSGNQAAVPETKD